MPSSPSPTPALPTHNDLVLSSDGIVVWPAEDQEVGPARARGREVARVPRPRSWSEDCLEVEVGPDWTVRAVSPRSRTLLGWDPAVLTGRTLCTILAVGDRAVLEHAAERARDGRPPTMVRVQLRRFDGSWRCLDACVSPGDRGGDDGVGSDHGDPVTCWQFHPVD